MIVVKDISKKFQKKIIFNELSFQIDDGEFVIITGNSGSGKTTLLNLIGQIETIDSGVIEIDGKRKFTNRDKNKFYRDKAGFIFQNYALIEESSVEKNLLIALAYYKGRKKEKYAKIKNALTEVGLEGFEKRSIYTLSGGEQQRVALARIIVKNPMYIFADEPTGNLDENNRKIVLSLIEKLHRQGKTIIVVTHDMQMLNLKSVDKHIDLNKF